MRLKKGVTGALQWHIIGISSIHCLQLRTKDNKGPHAKPGWLCVSICYWVNSSGSCSAAKCKDSCCMAEILNFSMWTHSVVCRMHSCWWIRRDKPTTALFIWTDISWCVSEDSLCLCGLCSNLHTTCHRTENIWWVVITSTVSYASLRLSLQWLSIRFG